MVEWRENKATGDNTEPPEKTRSYGLSSPLSTSVKEEIQHQLFPVKTSRAEYEKIYVELNKLGEGGYGAVYAGRRITDDALVAIKHVPREKACYTEMELNGKLLEVSEEAAMMVKAVGADGSSGTSAVITLLDYFDLEDELILIMERSVTLRDLQNYCRAKGGYLRENQAKIIMRQMVDVAIDLHSNGVFHRDIKLSNILIDTGSCVPHVRIIDFGSGCSVKEGFYKQYSGTYAKAPPEWILNREYQAAPTTVWQLGALLYDMLGHQHTFWTHLYLKDLVEIRSSLSKDCLDFLKKCLTIDPQYRATLEQLKIHPWIM